MLRIAFAIEKGGTAKTTSAVHLAHALARLGRMVLLVDTDAQDQCASHLGLPQFRPGLAEVVLGEITPRQAIVQARERLFLLPAGDRLAEVKGSLSAIAARVGASRERLLADALAFTAQARLDYVIMDTAPGYDALLVNVCLLADMVLAPVPPEMQAVRGMVRFFKTLRELGREPDAILPTIHDRRVGKTHRILNKLRRRFGERVLDHISYSAAVSEAAGAGLTVFEYQPGHTVAHQYEALAKRLDRSRREAA